ncbi:MAG TPA: amidohydrolase [candidate division Zixibacteria bacterium]|nr:amidohydrolase [candidate division Zixibacteria bacterium]
MKLRASPHPDLILFNGKIRSLAGDGAVFEALACTGSRIVATGGSDEIRRLAGPGTREVDLRGRTAIPGLTDAHVHLSEKGTAEMELVDCRDFYTDVHTVADILERLARRAAEAPAGSWIVAHGSPMQDFRLKEKRFPDRHDLDRAVPDHPVSISFGAHITVCNTRALAAAGITGDTADPPGGAIRRDPQTGEPTGELHERAQLIVKKVAPEFNYLQLKDGIVFALGQCLERGVTTVHDIVRSGEPVRAYQEIYREGRLHARVSLLPRVIESHIGSSSLIELGLLPGFGNEWLRIGGVKMSIDGGITGRNACFYEPYEDDPHNHGIIRIEQDELNDTVRKCHEAGLRCCVHAIGDRAFDMALDAYENALRHSPRRDHRHRIEHMGNWLSTPERMQRMTRWGIIAIPNIAIGYYVGDAILDCVGEKRLTKAFPFRTLLRNGVIIAGGSDSPGYWPVDPLRDIAACVSRRMRWGEVWVPEERISVAEAFAMHTTTAAYAGFEENDKGTLDVGKLADIAVLAEDPFEIQPERIKDLKVEMTVVGGEIKYQA